MHAAAVFLLIIAAVMLYAYMATPEYESTAEILVLPKTNEGAVISSGLDESRITMFIRKWSLSAVNPF